VRKSSGGRLRLSWKPFLLEQINADRGPNWKAWEDEGFESRDIPPLAAAKCAALQGEVVFDAFHRACFRAQHLEGRAVADLDVLMEVARCSGLDMASFQRDFEDDHLRAVVGREHEEAVGRWGVFGVPTLVYPSGEAVFLKLAPGEWEARGDDGLFEQLIALFASRPYLLEAKKPESTGFKKSPAPTQR
jgi:protein-disulfide isomerase-like protein with CxxC motif